MTDLTPPPADEPVAAPTNPPAPTYPPAPPAGSPVAAPQNGLGTAALVMAILQFVCLGPIASILAIIFGRMGMNKAKQGLATNGGVATVSFWLGIVGLILTVIGAFIAFVVIGFGVTAVVESVDLDRNSETGLADGGYRMEPNSSIFVDDRCAFGGSPVSIESEQSAGGRVTVVGEGDAQCGASMRTPQYVIFSVSGGVAEILEVG